MLSFSMSANASWMRLGSTVRGPIGWASLAMCFRLRSWRSLRGVRITGARCSRFLRPGFDLDKARQQRADDGKPEWFGEDDLYPDVRPALARLRDAGLWVGIAGNQDGRCGRQNPARSGSAGRHDRDLGRLGSEQADPGFFRKMIEESPVGPDETLYVGDRLVNDIVPAARLGLRMALLDDPWPVGDDLAG